ncbi:hypothetical protein VTO42DRAFT_4036 [Malbranchea cinnamomea]
MSTTMSGTYSSTPDTHSPVFPGRLIRPLPKRPIRSRLSPEVAESILYPPAPPTTQLFYGTYTGNGEVTNDSKVYVQQNSYEYEHSPERNLQHSYEDGVDSAEEDGPVVVRRSVGFSRSSSSSPGFENRQKYAKQIGSSPNKSAGSGGPDGYDAFENTNNKKKRKIPTSGSLGGHSGLTTDLANLGISSPGGGNAVSLEDGGGTGSYYGSGNPASPAGGVRGRFSRSNVRTPNGRTQMSTSSWSNGGSCVASPVDQLPKNSNQGTATSDAASPTQSQEQAGLVEQTKVQAPSKTQFTFTCESDSSKGMTWQTQNSYAVPQHNRVPTQPISAPVQGQRGFSTQGTQTSPNMTAQANAHTQPSSTHPNESAQAPSQPRKPRRSAKSLYALAARQRRLQQQYTNLHHPPSPEDIWICEFCEYESIFGHPPEALIRQYEIKDRKERRRLAEKRRLLEKAKMKGRKGKKPTKNAAKNAAAQVPAHQQAYDRQPHTDRGTGSHGSIGDDYLGDEYDDEIPPLQPIPPNSAPQPAAASVSPQPNAKQNLNHAGGHSGKTPADAGTTRPS